MTDADLHGFAIPKRNETAFATRVLAEAAKRYTDPRRGYHDLGHIKFCLDALSDYADEHNDFLALHTAIYFHDVVYEPGNPDNEKLSADWADEYMVAVGRSEDHRDKVRDLIMDTTHREPSKTRDGRLMQDIDLLGFALIPSEESAAGIRHEFQHVPDEIYYPERIKILQWFLDKPQLYHTDVIRETYEETARRKIQEEIDQIRSGGFSDE